MLTRSMKKIEKASREVEAERARPNLKPEQASPGDCQDKLAKAAASQECHRKQYRELLCYLRHILNDTRG